MQRLEHRFAPARSHILACACFNRRLQQTEEDVGKYTTALRALASKCGYPETVVEELIRDRLIAGAQNEKIRERLLLEPDTLTPDRALVLAETNELAAK